MVDSIAEQQRDLEPGNPVPPEIVTGTGGERRGLKCYATFMAIGFPLTAFATFSGGYGAGEIAKFSLEVAQAGSIIPQLSEFQVHHLSNLVAPVGTATGFIGGFVLTKMITEVPRLLRS